MAFVNQETNADLEYTPLYEENLQKMLGLQIIAAAGRKDRNMRPLINFGRKIWEALKCSNGQYWYKICIRLHVRED